MEKNMFIEMVNGKSFRKDDSNIVYTFLKDRNKILITGDGETKTVPFTMWTSEIHNMIDTDGLLSNEMFQYQILSNPNDVLIFKLWGNIEKRTFGLFTEVMDFE